MLEKLKLINFRCFEDHEISFNSFNVIVGKNNTGKSTVIDALKLISNVCRYAPHRVYYLKERDIPFSTISLRYNYIDIESVVYASFSNNIELRITFPLEDEPYFEFLHSGFPINNKEISKFISKNSLGVIPPVGTFDETESQRDKKYLASILISYLAPRHFRNIWYLFKEGFQEFQHIIESTWPGYTIKPPEYDFNSNRLYMFFEENRFTREIFWAGHGFQVWLQLMTFLVKLGNVNSLILDEPDIYLHSDMQKKLVNICKERSNQVIIATHAVDIIEEVAPDDIICIDKESKSSKRLSNIDEVQSIIGQLGSFQNLKLVHFLRGRKCLFVEGQDFKCLKILASKTGFQSFAKEDDFSVIPIEGFTNWDRLKHVDWIYKNTLGESIQCYVILDRDYYTEKEINSVIHTLGQKGVQAHVWMKKELENYAINFDSLYRIFTSKYQGRYGNVRIPLTNEEFKESIISLFEEFKDQVLSQTMARESDAINDKSISQSTIFKQILPTFNRNWESLDFRMNVIPGKEFFSKLNTWLNNDFHISISINDAFFTLRSDEIDTEIIETISEFTKFVKP